MFLQRCDSVSRVSIDRGAAKCTAWPYSGHDGHSSTGKEVMIMPRNETGPDFIEALARGLDVIKAFEPGRPFMSLSEVAAATGLARPTVRRILLTLEELGYARSEGGCYALTPRVLELGVSYVHSMSLWDVARPHM